MSKDLGYGKRVDEEGVSDQARIPEEALNLVFLPIKDPYNRLLHVSDLYLFRFNRIICYCYGCQVFISLFSLTLVGMFFTETSQKQESCPNCNLLVSFHGST